MKNLLTATIITATLALTGCNFEDMPVVDTAMDEAMSIYMDTLDITDDVVSDEAHIEMQQYVSDACEFIKRYDADCKGLEFVYVDYIDDGITGRAINFNRSNALILFKAEYVENVSPASRKRLAYHEVMHIAYERNEFMKSTTDNGHGVFWQLMMFEAGQPVYTDYMKEEGVDCYFDSNCF